MIVKEALITTTDFSQDLPQNSNDFPQNFTASPDFFSLFEKHFRATGLSAKALAEEITERSKEHPAFLEAGMLYPSTITRVLNREDRPHPVMVYRIALLGFKLSPAKCMELAEKRRETPHVNHRMKDYMPAWLRLSDKEGKEPSTTDGRSPKRVKEEVCCGD